MARQNFSFSNDDGEQLAGVLETPADGDIRAVALFAHCFTCTKNIRAAANIAGALAAQGIACLRFDFTGLGESEGDFASSGFSANVADLVAGVLQCLDADSTGCETVNLAYGDSTTVRDVYDLLRKFTREQLPDQVIPDPVTAPPRAGDVRHSLADVRRATQRFGFAPKVGFAEGLRETFAWYRAQLGA